MLVKRTAPFVIVCKGTPIKPGLNRVTEVVAVRLREDKLFMEQCKLGNQVILDEEEVIDDGETLSDAILEMRVDDAVAAVKETLDIDELRSLKSREKRVTVGRAIEAQIDRLTEDRDSKNEDEDEE